MANHRGPGKDTSGLEVEAQCGLSGAIAGILRSLRCTEHTEGGRVINLRCWRCEVCVIQHICKARFEAEFYSFVNWNNLRSSKADGNSSWTLKHTNTSIAEPSRTNGRWSEGRQVEELLA